MDWKRKLQARTRDPAFLWKMALAILAAGLVAGFLLESTQSGQFKNRPERQEYEQLLETLDEHAKVGRWAELWWGIPSSMKYSWSYKGPLLLAVMTGVCWFAFLMQALKIRGFLDPKFWLSVLALVLGVLSIWPTLFFIYWQDFSWGLQRSPELVGGLRFFVLGVGLREEFAKLLCVLPLMPFLLRIRSELAALLICACVGLGFAVEENTGYFLREKGASVVARYVMANPFHMTMTGLVGLAVYRGLRSPRDWGPHILVTFGMMVFAHGLYNAFFGLPALSEYSLIGTIVFALVVYQFFRELRELRPRGRDTVSLTANFVCGVSLVTAFTFIFLSANADWNSALDAMVPNALGMAVMVYLFLREMPESLVSV